MKHPSGSPSFHDASHPGAGENASFSDASDMREEWQVDGVRLSRFAARGRVWRMGCLHADGEWEFEALPPEFGAAELTTLTGKGVRLAEDKLPPPLALICCGQGSVYPGMGRELYDCFPPAREAMDRIAALTDGDLLGLMDEKDPEALMNVRRQHTYLFLLEYAQAHYLQSLGLRPAVIAGHSLGELIALCLAGVYTPEWAWHILDNRSRLTSELESDTGLDTSMMSVHAGQEVIDACLAEFPSLCVCNYNTPAQFILGGPCEDLRAASRALRKRRVPAIQLNVRPAFHHPGMRVMREISLKGLREVPMRSARVPLLSNVTADLYPDDEEGIREYMLDLDENPVRWIACVEFMRRRHKARHYLELGPSDTLCGLVTDILPEAVCIPVGRKGREAERLRTAVAALYALGHLPLPSPHRICSRAVFASEQTEFSPPSSFPPEKTSAGASSFPAHVEAVLPVIMDVSGLMRRDLHPDMDLRYDIGLRSGNFPLLLHEVEQRFGIFPRFEDLEGVATLRDLAERIRVLRGQAADFVEEGVARPVSKNAGGEGRMVETSRHFSHFHELWLADARPLPGSPHPCIPPSAQLAALLESAGSAFPGCMPSGAEELSFSPFPCPVGVTREIRARCSARADAREPEVAPHSCRVELLARNITANGRAVRTSTTCCAGLVLFEPRSVPPVEPLPSAVSSPLEAEALAGWYDAHSGLGEGLRLLTRVQAAGGARALARMRSPSAPDIARLDNPGYIYPTCILEGMGQAAFWLALEGSPLSRVSDCFDIASLALFCFTRSCAPGEILEIDVRLDPSAAQELCFNAEAHDRDAQIVAYARSLRFAAKRV